MNGTTLETKLCHQKSVHIVIKKYGGNAKNVDISGNQQFLQEPARQKMDVHAVTVVLLKELDVLIKKKTPSCFLIQHDKQQINLMLRLHLSVRVAETKKWALGYHWKYIVNN